MTAKLARSDQQTRRLRLVLVLASSLGLWGVMWVVGAALYHMISG
ncbi:MAG TPA: hypothetical protein VLN57_07470 [Xanthobacteraceae bacterium]|nr:hypothetical protein [Xanthobacteraceae bacterium]